MNVRKKTPALRRAYKNNKGFTLIEVIISIAVLGIICAVLLRLFVLAGSTNDRANRKQDAQLSVNSAVEVLVCSETVYSALDELGISFSGNMTDATFICPDKNYDIIIKLDERSGEYPGALYDISVCAEDQGTVFATVSTSTYYKEQTRD